MSADAGPDTIEFVDAWLHERRLLMEVDGGTTWSDWARVVYCMAPDGYERRYFLAVAEGGPNVWDAVDVAHRLGGKDAVCGLVEGLLAQEGGHG